MCTRQNIVRKNFFGELCYCSDHKIFHLMFSNILIELTESELRAFHLVVKEIDVDYWNKLKINKEHKRKFPICTSQQNLVLLFNLKELEALRELVLINSKISKKYISFQDEEFCIYLN